MGPRGVLIGALLLDLRGTLPLRAGALFHPAALLVDPAQVALAARQERVCVCVGLEPLRRVLRLTCADALGRTEDVIIGRQPLRGNGAVAAAPSASVL
eukprot:scaffold84914_cov37-Phaeocystis_antarctica.AAC.1